MMFINLWIISALLSSVQQKDITYTGNQDRKQPHITLYKREGISKGIFSRGAGKRDEAKKLSMGGGYIFSRTTQM